MSLQGLKLILFANICSLALPTGASEKCFEGEFVCPEDRQKEFPLPLADPNDCNFFHICYRKGKVHRDSCGPEAHFNGKMCVQGWCPTAIPGCEPQETPKRTTTTTQTPTKTTMTPPVISTTETPITGFFECPEDTGEFPDPNDCKYFFVCYTSDIMLRLSCGQDQHFNGQSCVAGKCPSKIPGAEPLLPKDTDCDVKSFECNTERHGELGDPNDCNFYFICHNQDIFLRNKCQTGFYFGGERCIPGTCPNRIEDSCEPQSSTRETIAAKSITSKLNRTCLTGKFVCPIKPEKGSYVLPDPNDCRYYHKCTFMGDYRHDCGDGYHYAGGNCVRGNCPYLMPDCKHLLQERECLTGDYELGKGQKSQYDENDCRYYFVRVNGQTERKDCGKGKHFMKFKCEDGPCPFALPKCKPREAKKKTRK